MQAPERYTWIQTRDGSPTLWDNSISEPFRSFKGAFTESFAVFVRPAIESLQPTELHEQSITVGEFGLGPGTNWLIWNLTARALNLKTHYFVIERDLVPFQLGHERWLQLAPKIAAFLRETLGTQTQLDICTEWVRTELTSLPQPECFAFLEDAIAARRTARVWFHDPFGFEVNPDGYSPETLSLCARLWGPNVWGGSYACNRLFCDELASLPGVRVQKCETGVEGLKRQRLQFQKGAI